MPVAPRADILLKPATQRSANSMTTCYPDIMAPCSTNIMVPWSDEMGDGFPSIRTENDWRAGRATRGRVNSGVKGNTVDG